MRVEDGDCKDEPGMKAEDDDEDDDNGGKKMGDAEEVQVRDIRYQLETLVTKSFPCYFPKKRFLSHD